MAKIKAASRISKLIESGSFKDIDHVNLDFKDPFCLINSMESIDGVFAGLAKVNGIDVALFAQEPSYMGGSMGKRHIDRIRRTILEAKRLRIPVIGLYDSSGARVQEGVQSLSEAGVLFKTIIDAREEIPQVSAIFDIAVGGAAYSAALSDFLIMVKGAKAFVWGPGVIKAEFGKEISMEELGGTHIHERSGLVSLTASSENACIKLIKRLISYLNPKQNGEVEQKEINKRHHRQLSIGSIFDDGTFLEIQKGFATTVRVGLARLGGKTVGVIATNKGRYLGIDSAIKISKFIQSCRSLRVPLITLLDTKGYLPSKEEEEKGLIDFTSRLIISYAQTKLPKITAILGEVYGGAFVSMASKGLVNYVISLPDAKIAPLSPEAYLEIFHEEKLRVLSRDERVKLYDKLLSEYLSNSSPDRWIASGYIDEVTSVNSLRNRLIELLDKFPG